MSLPTCKIHGISYGARFSECPICVREDRDRLRSQLDESRRPAEQKKRLKNEPWITSESVKFRVVFPDGKGLYTREPPVLSKDKKGWIFDEPYTIDHRVYDSTNWQESLERRPE